MAITPDDFNKIWSSSATTPAYNFSDTEYQEGWDFVGNMPPTRGMWNALQKQTDEKMQYIFANFGSPLVANTVADMTETTRVYVYTGSEAGYTAGHWYYWDGSAWADGGVYNSIAVATDTSLSVAGKPADAQATGEAIGRTKAEMSLFGVDDVLWDNTAPNSTTHNGISYSVDKNNKAITVSGTSTGASVLTFLSASSPFPVWLTKGKKYIAHFDTTAEVYFQVRATINGTATVICETRSRAEFIIPASTTALNIRLYVKASGKTISSTVVKPFISEAETLGELTDGMVQKMVDIGAIVPRWESIFINTTTGVESATTHYSTSDFVPVSVGEKLIVVAPQGVGVRLFYYNNEMSFISSPSGFTNQVYEETIPASVSYIKISTWDADSGATADVSADYGKQVKAYRLDGALYKALEYCGVRWLNMTQTDFTTTDALPLNTICRVQRTWMDDTIETLPYYGTVEYYFLTLGRQTDGSYKSQMAFDFQNSLIYIRRYSPGDGTWGNWVSTDEYVQLEYNGTDLTEGYYYNFNPAYTNVTFDKVVRLSANASYLCKIIPVKKGDIVHLQTTGGSGNARAYAKLTYNYYIDEVYDNTGGTRFIGDLSFDYDGFLVVNCTLAYKDKFRCFIKSANKTFSTNAKFVNSVENPERMFPDYGNDNPCRALLRGSSMMGSIHSWGIIGASFDSGEMNYTVPGVGYAKEIEWYEYSCWNVLKKLNDIPDLYIYADGGQNAKEWFTLGADTVRGYAYASDTEVVCPYSAYGRSGIGYGGGCWWKVKEDEQKQAYLINLGSNDINNNYPFDENWDLDPNYDPTMYYECGTTADIGTYDYATDTDTVPAGKTAGVIPGVVNSYCAYMGAILNRLIAKAPDCVIFLATIRGGISGNSKIYAVWEQYNEALREIAQMPQFKDNVILIDWGKFGLSFASYEMRQMIVGKHPNALGYHFLAYWWNTLIDKAIFDNFIRLQQSMYIGTNKHYNPADME